MNILVIESCPDPRTLQNRLAAAMVQECEDLTVLFVQRDGQEAHPSLVDSVSRLSYTVAFESMQLREDGLGTLLRLVRKRFKKAAKFAICFDDECIDNPHAMRRMFAEVAADCVFATTGWSARDKTALRCGEVALGALPTFPASRIDGLAVAGLDALDASEGGDRRRVLFERLAGDATASFVPEILVTRDVASIAVEYADGVAISSTPRLDTTAVATSANKPTPPVAAAPKPPLPDDLDDEPLLAHALSDSVDPTAPPRATARETSGVDSLERLADGIDEDVSALLEGLGGATADDGGSGVDFSPGLSLDVDTNFTGEKLDEDSKLLLVELANEGRLDFEELEASLGDDLDAILFVRGLPNIPDDLRDRLRQKFLDAGGDPSRIDSEQNKTLAVGDIEGEDLDDDTRAILAAAIDGPPDLSWQNEDVETPAAAAPVPEDAGPKEPSEDELEAALASLAKIEETIDESARADDDTAQEADSETSGLDGWFEDFEREDGDGADTPSIAASEPSPVSPPKVDAWQPETEHDKILYRARETARQIADSLVVLQQPNGEFMEPERYAKECAAALWHALDPDHYRDSIQLALEACRNREESLSAASITDAQLPLRAYSLSAIGLQDDLREALHDPLCIDSLVEAVVRSRRGQVFDLKRINMVRRALDDHGALFDRWAPEDPNAQPLNPRDQAFAALLAGELAIRTPGDAQIAAFARKLEDRLLAIARTRAVAGMFVAAAAFRSAARRGDETLMTNVLDRFDKSSWNGDGSSELDGYSESLAFLGLQLASEQAIDSVENRS